MLIAFQQKYKIVSAGNEESYLTLVIGILTLYGVLYAFFQFTISYALQNKYDKFWGRSMTKTLFLKRLGFNIFTSSIFKVLILYASVYPILEKKAIEILTGTSRYNAVIQASWEICLLLIFTLYLNIFLRTLGNMRALFNMQESRRMYLDVLIKDEISEEYRESFEYSCRKNSNFLLNSIFAELKTIPKEEQRDMLMYVINEIFFSIDPSKPNKKISGFFSICKHDEFNYKPYFIYNFFKMLYKKIEETKIDLNLSDLLNIWNLQAIAINNSSVIEKDKGKYEQIYNVFSTYSNDRSYPDNYFTLPLEIKKKVLSYNDVELVHECVTQRECHGYAIDSFTNKTKKSNEYETFFSKSYEKYLIELLRLYNKFVDGIKNNEYSHFWGFIGSSYNSEFMDNQTSEIIYDYMINLECTEQNKKYVLFLTRKLKLKFKVSLVFYHMLYTGSSWEWKNEVVLFRRIVQLEWNSETIYSKAILGYVCHRISKSNIGHRIEEDLIVWISQHINISRFNEKIIERCLMESYLSPTKFLKFIYIFSERNSYPIGFYDFDFMQVKNTNYRRWEMVFLSDIVSSPQLLKVDFFVSHLIQLCRNISYTTEDYIYEDDYRVFFCNIHFNLSEKDFYALFYNERPGKGIVEYLILKLPDITYEYLMSGILSSYYATRVRDIIQKENKSIQEYVEDLVKKTNECSTITISVLDKENIVGKIRYLIEK
ncbi:hypothetical protein [Paenibacillus amylolyticus]|uniref:hypothetical protein n=1 Tax=Paenibacillus amylolyticus TaxID=1451 RepID=UPI00249CD9F9|nr:hypothetical protein [Paenibacillus amylolyticus]WFA83189.1 hypothetical protein OGI70_19415 [Paenibacillus amylolyticus]